MVFNNLVASIRNRTARGRHGISLEGRPASVRMGSEEREDTPAERTTTIDLPATAAEKPAPTSQMTNKAMLEAAMKSFAGMKKSESRQAITLPHVPHFQPMTFSNLSHIMPVEENEDPFGAKKPIVRKPLSPESPCAPKPYAHQARAGLRARYQSKVEVEAEELEKRVEGDVAWVVELWEKAGRGKPSDEDIVGFYDLWLYIEESKTLQARPKSSML